MPLHCSFLVASNKIHLVMRVFFLCLLTDTRFPFLPQECKDGSVINNMSTLMCLSNVRRRQTGNLNK